MARKRWSDLTDREKTTVVVMASVQLALATTAWIDLARRPAELVRGPKLAWAAVIAVNFAGPIAYFTVGRLRGSGAACCPDGDGGTGQQDCCDGGPHPPLS
jgi:hypothetical protein